MTILNKMLEDSNTRHLESSEKFTVLLSELQERIRTFEEVHTNQSAQLAKAQSVDVEVQTDVNSIDIVVATSSFSKMIRYLIMLRNPNILALMILMLSIVTPMLTLYVNYRATTVTTNYTLPTVHEFHEKVSVVLYELIDQSTLSWPDKLHYWSNTATIVTPVVVKFSEFSKLKHSTLKSSRFFGFTNGYLMYLRVIPSGSPGIATKGIYFPINKSFTVELLNPTDNHSHLQKEIFPYSNGCNVGRVTADDNDTECGFPHFVPLGGYNFKQKCTCDKANMTICCYLSDDDNLYF